MFTTNYDFKKVSTIVAGFIITGYMDGEPISVEKNEDDVFPHVGADGEVTYAEGADDTGIITLSLKQTSAVLPQLQELRKSKKIFPISILDSNTRTYKTGGTEARILKMPARTYGTEVQGVEVQIHVAHLKEE
ncbi:phage structural protein [Bacillus sp. JJ722]|uniref:phage structural protein n=1 Tax=Bacillus sp. JJ722 TaxID=3122973 RepID=UPI002FFDA56A